MASDRLQQTGRIAFALGLGAVGGWVFWTLNMPLPWMLGALFATMAAAVAGLPVAGPTRVRGAVVAVIGVLLGAGFTPALLAQIGSWSLTLAGLALYLAMSLVLLVPYFRKIGGFDRRTAYFAAMPGGLSEMVELAESAKADVPRVILAQSLRIVTTIAVIAIWFRWVQGLPVGQVAGRAGFSDLATVDLAILAAAAVIGSALGLALRLPAPTLLGPMVISAVLHLTEVTKSAPPSELVVLAQVILGTILGTRFVGISAGALGRAVGLSLGATLVMLVIAIGFALVLHRLTGQSADQILLAYAPGGLTEMSLVALALHAEAAFVATHHVVRILMVIVAAPVLFRFWNR